MDISIAREMLPIVYEHPQMDFDSVLASFRFKKRSKEELLAPIGFLKEKYKEIGKKKTNTAEIDWVMGQLRKQAVGNMNLNVLKASIENY